MSLLLQVQVLSMVGPRQTRNGCIKWTLSLLQMVSDVVSNFKTYQVCIKKYIFMNK